MLNKSQRGFQHIVFIVFLILLTSGCLSMRAKTLHSEDATQIESSWLRHKKQVEQINHWRMQGRIAARHETQGGQASFIWEQWPHQYRIKLFGPFGAKATYITGRPQFVLLQEANGTRHKGQTPEDLMRQFIGWEIPVQGMRYWMLGIPDPEHKIQKQQLSLDGQLLLLEQSGWTIHYKNYQFYNQLSFPTKVQMENGPIQIKMILQNIEPII